MYVRGGVHRSSFDLQQCAALRWHNVRKLAISKSEPYGLQPVWAIGAMRTFVYVLRSARPSPMSARHLLCERQLTDTP